MACGHRGRSGGGENGPGPALPDRGHQRPDRQPQTGAAGRYSHPWPACLFLPGAGPVPGGRVGRRPAHRRAGLLSCRDPFPRYELPLLHLAAGCVPAGRGAAEEAERHAAQAEEAAASLDYGQERLYAAMARALVCQASGDYLGMAGALGHWRDDSALDGRSRVYAVLWRPLLAEGLVGSGQAEQADVVLAQLRTDSAQVGYLAPGPGLAGRMAGRTARRPRAGPADLQPRRGHRRPAKPGSHGPAAAGPRPTAAAYRK